MTEDQGSVQPSALAKQLKADLTYIARRLGGSATYNSKEAGKIIQAALAAGMYGGRGPQNGGTWFPLSPVGEEEDSSS